MKILVYMILTHQANCFIYLSPPRSKYNKLPTSEVGNCWNPGQCLKHRREARKRTKVFRTVLATEKCVSEAGERKQKRCGNTVLKLKETFELIWSNPFP